MLPGLSEPRAGRALGSGQDPSLLSAIETNNPAPPSPATSPPAPGIAPLPPASAPSPGAMVRNFYFPVISMFSLARPERTGAPFGCQARVRGNTQRRSGEATPGGVLGTQRDAPRTAAGSALPLPLPALPAQGTLSTLKPCEKGDLTSFRRRCLSINGLNLMSFNTLLCSRYFMPSLQNPVTFFNKI